MTDSVQLTILKGLTTFLEGVQNIPTLTGVQNDLTGRVFRNRILFGAEQSTPFLNILEAVRKQETGDIVTGPDLLTYEARWDLLIQGFLAGDSDNPCDLVYNFKALTEQRLALIVALGPNGDPSQASPFYRLNGLIPDMRIAPGFVRPPSGTTGQTECFYLPLTLVYTINLATPFTFIP